MTKVDPPPLRTELDKICHLAAHFDHFLELNNASISQILRPYMHFPGSYGHLKIFFLVHFYTFYNFQMAITP